jgi:hypothetical protein
MSNLDDILTATKNIVVALNNANSFYKQQFAQSSKTNLSANTLLAANAGRLYTISVTTAGSTAGAVYDANSIANASASNLITNIPATAGTITFNWPYANGLVYKPGTGQVASISYS